MVPGTPAFGEGRRPWSLNEAVDANCALLANRHPALRGLKPHVFTTPFPAPLEAEELFLGFFVAFWFQVSLPRQLENIRIICWTASSTSKELINGESLRRLKLHFVRREQPWPRLLSSSGQSLVSTRFLFQAALVLLGR